MTNNVVTPDPTEVIWTAIKEQAPHVLTPKLVFALVLIGVVVVFLKIVKGPEPERRSRRRRNL